MDYANRISVRISCTATEMGGVVLAIVKGLQQAGYEVEVISDEYPNRRGADVRRYISVKKES